MTLIKSNKITPLFNQDWPELFDFPPFFESKTNPVFSKPMVNVKESDKEYEIQFSAPGLSKNDFNVTIENGTIIISAEKEEEKKEEKDNYTRQEFNFSSFSRAFSLPENADENKISAKYDSGVLKITVQKTAGNNAPETKKINVE
jgi:HSP20 family protein